MRPLHNNICTCMAGALRRVGGFPSLRPWFGGIALAVAVQNNNTAWRCIFYMFLGCRKIIHM